MFSTVVNKLKRVQALSEVCGKLCGFFFHVRPPCILGFWLRPFLCSASLSATADQTTDHRKPITFPGPPKPTRGWPQGSANPRPGEGLTNAVARLCLLSRTPHRDPAVIAPCPTEQSYPHPPHGCTPALLDMQPVTGGCASSLSSRSFLLSFPSPRRPRGAKAKP